MPTGPATGPRSTQIADNQAIVNAAATKYGIPGWVLWGVYGMETAFGANVRTSSAGAVGSFQFLPSTAASYGYPVSNATDTATFTAQANAAAHYLSDLFHQTGSWNTALERYSGGGYGASQVQAKGGTSGIDPTKIPVVGPVIKTAGDVASSVGDVASSVGQIATLLTSADFWLRIGEFILGAVALYLGLHALTGQSSTPGQQVKHVTRIVPLPI